MGWACLTFNLVIPLVFVDGAVSWFTLPAPRAPWLLLLPLPPYAQASHSTHNHAISLSKTTPPECHNKCHVDYLLSAFLIPCFINTFEQSSRLMSSLLPSLLAFRDVRLSRRFRGCSSFSIFSNGSVKNPVHRQQHINWFCPSFPHHRV